MRCAVASMLPNKSTSPILYDIVSRSILFACSALPCGSPTRGFYGCPSHCCAEYLLTTFTYILSYLDLPLYTKRNCSIVIPVVRLAFDREDHLSVFVGMSHGLLHGGLLSQPDFSEIARLVFLGGLVPLLTVSRGLPLLAEQWLATGLNIIILAYCVTHMFPLLL